MSEEKSCAGGYRAACLPGCQGLPCLRSIPWNESGNVTIPVLTDQELIELRRLEDLRSEVRAGNNSEGPSLALLCMADAGADFLLDLYQASERTAADVERLLARSREVDRICRALGLDRGKDAPTFEQNAYAWLQEQGIRPPVDLSDE